MMNGEKYRDPTADEAIRSAEKTPDRVMEVVNLMKALASVAGFEVVGRIKLKDKASGKEWR